MVIKTDLFYFVMLLVLVTTTLRHDTTTMQGTPIPLSETQPIYLNFTVSQTGSPILYNNIPQTTAGVLRCALASYSTVDAAPGVNVGQVIDQFSGTNVSQRQAIAQGSDASATFVNNAPGPVILEWAQQLGADTSSTVYVNSNELGFAEPALSYEYTYTAPVAKTQQTRIYPSITTPLVPNNTPVATFAPVSFLSAATQQEMQTNSISPLDVDIAASPALMVNTPYYVVSVGTNSMCLGGTSPTGQTITGMQTSQVYYLGLGVDPVTPTGPPVLVWTALAEEKVMWKLMRTGTLVSASTTPRILNSFLANGYLFAGDAVELVPVSTSAACTAAGAASPGGVALGKTDSTTHELDVVPATDLVPPITGPSLASAQLMVDDTNAMKYTQQTAAAYTYVAPAPQTPLPAGQFDLLSLNADTQATAAAVDSALQLCQPSGMSAGVGLYWAVPQGSATTVACAPGDSVYAAQPANVPTRWWVMFDMWWRTHVLLMVGVMGALLALLVVVGLEIVWHVRRMGVGAGAVVAVSPSQT